MFKNISYDMAIHEGYTHLCVYYGLYIYMMYDETGFPKRYMTRCNFFSFITDFFYEIELTINQFLEILNNPYEYQYSFKIIRELNDEKL